MARSNVDVLAEELARILWDAFRGKPITLDRRGRPNYIVVRSFARQLIRLALQYGIEDPLHEIDWVSILDPNLSREENLRLVERYLAALARRRLTPAEELAEAESLIEQQIAYLEQQLVHATPEEREAIVREIEALRRELEELRRRTRRAAAAPAPPAPPPRRPPAAAPAPTPPPSPRPRAPQVPGLEELRSRIEYWVRRQVPRVYRLDWSRGCRVRISCHREVVEQLRRKLEEVLGCRVVGERRARPPLVIIEADCCGASPPPVPVPPDMQRWLLWEKFSAALTAAGLNPQEHREELERVVEATEGLPFEERQRRVEELARRLVEEAQRRREEELARRIEERLRAAMPAAGVTPAEFRMLMERLLGVAERLTRLEQQFQRQMEELRREVTAAVAATAMPEPRVTRMVDEATGMTYVAPHPEILPILRAVYPIPHDEYYLSSPRAQVWVWGQLPLYAYIEMTLREPQRFISAYALAQMPWLMDFLRQLRDRLLENVRLGWEEYTRVAPRGYREAKEALLSYARLVVARVYRAAGREPPPPGSSVYAHIYWRLWRLFDRLAYEVYTGEITLDEARRLLEPQVEQLARMALEGRI